MKKDSCCGGCTERTDNIKHILKDFFDLKEVNYSKYIKSEQFELVKKDGDIIVLDINGDNIDGGWLNIIE